MFSRFLFALALTVGSVSAFLDSSGVSAQTLLTRAVVQNLRKDVQLRPSHQPVRKARVNDVLLPWDALATARQSLAELRFNDGSLARIGERAIFQFVPNTRTFDLRNGTALFLIPRGQGRTRVVTPNAAAGIRGSALFARYNQAEKASFFGALTKSEIEITNQDGTQRRVLEPGEMAIVIQDRIVDVQTFDLKTFYETSRLVAGLELTQSKGTGNSDPALDLVREETADALKKQAPVDSKSVVVAAFKMRDSGEKDGFPQDGDSAGGQQAGIPLPLDPKLGPLPTDLSPMSTGVTVTGTPRPNSGKPGDGIASGAGTDQPRVGGIVPPATGLFISKPDVPSNPAPGSSSDASQAGLINPSSTPSYAPTTPPSSNSVSPSITPSRVTYPDPSPPTVPSQVVPAAATVAPAASRVVVPEVSTPVVSGAPTTPTTVPLAPTQSAPAVAGPAVQPAAAPAPAVTTPAVTTPAVTTPAVTTPAVTTPAVTTPVVPAATPAVPTTATPTTPATTTPTAVPSSGATPVPQAQVTVPSS